MVATVGDNVRRIRTLRGLSQEEVARRLGYKRPSNATLIERRKALPKPQQIMRFAIALQCSPSELLQDVITPYDRLRMMTASDWHTAPSAPRAPRQLHSIHHR